MDLTYSLGPESLLLQTLERAGHFCWEFGVTVVIQVMSTFSVTNTTPFCLCLPCRCEHRPITPPNLGAFQLPIVLWLIDSFFGIHTTSSPPPLVHPCPEPLCYVVCMRILKNWSELQLISFEEFQDTPGESISRAGDHWCKLSLLGMGNFSVLAPSSPFMEAHDNWLFPPHTHATQKSRMPNAGDHFPQKISTWSQVLPEIVVTKPCWDNWHASTFERYKAFYKCKALLFPIIPTIA